MMGPWIWFNLLLFTNGHWKYIDALETLEECQELQKWYEQHEPGNYYCLPANVELTQRSKNDHGDV